MAVPRSSTLAPGFLNPFTYLKELAVLEEKAEKSSQPYVV
jgi:hypothetical protein